MENYLHVKLHTDARELQELLIAQLSLLGYEGFEESESHLSAYIPEQQFDEAALQALLIPLQVTATREVLAPKNWNEEWEKNFEPVTIEGFCAVRAAFHAPVTTVQHEIIITPKMSFGTGHHATTHMMMTLMQGLPLKGKTVLDFGTGTGILAILAHRLGAGTVTAIDNDDWSIDNAAENFVVNQCAAIKLKKAENLAEFDRFDVILANISKHVLLANMESMKQHLNKGGVLIVSGLLPGDAADMITEAQKKDLTVKEQKAYNNWIAMVFTLS